MQTVTVQQQSTSTSMDQLPAGSEGVMIGVLIALAIIGILFIVAWWKIFKKAGLAGWKSIIPIYSQYCLFRISGMSGWWILLPLITGICAGLGMTVVATNGDAVTYQINPMFYVALVLSLCSAIVEIVQLVKLAEGFKKGLGFKIASIFFPNITCLILAFGKAKYNKKYLHK